MKQKKKLTPKQKEELKARIKKITLSFIHIICYVCTALFVLVCVVASLQGCNSQPKKASNNGVQSAPTRSLVSRDNDSPIKLENLDRYFYPYDVKPYEWHTLHLNFSNYNYLKYFVPSYNDFIKYDSYISTTLSDASWSFVSFTAKAYDSASNSYISNFDIDNLGLSITALAIYSNNEEYRLGFYSGAVNPYTIYSFNIDGTFALDPSGSIGTNFGSNAIYTIFDYLFVSNLVQVKYSGSLALPFNNKVASFFYYYMSANSFDYNSYTFGGLDKYVSFTSLFRRVYNGFFVYYPSHDDLTYTHSLFKGVWEYKNTIYTDIVVNIQRAWNGSILYQAVNDLSPHTYEYSINYISPSSNLGWFSDIFSGDSEALTNYYFITSIDMVSVYGDRVTLAYNRYANHVQNVAGRTITTSVFPSISLRLWNDDSFLFNNNINFVLYSIDYDYNFTLASDLFVPYKYYSDFFFTAFYYTGLYHTQPLTDNDDTIFVLVPVIGMLSMALTGMLPLLNTYILPGVSIGTLFALPFIVSIILFVVKLFKR